MFKQRQTTGTNISCLCDSDYKTTVKFEYDKCKPRVHNQIGGTNLPIITFSFPTILNIFLFIFIDYLRYLYRFEDTRSTKRLEDSTMLSAPHVSSHYLEKELKNHVDYSLEIYFQINGSVITILRQIKNKSRKKVKKQYVRDLVEYLQEAKTISIPDVKPAGVAKRKVHTILC